MAREIALLTNPTSGKGSGRGIGALTHRLLVEAGHDVTDVSGADYQQARSRAREAVESGVDTLVVVGGDGMVHLGVNLCALTPTRLAVVAAGTGKRPERLFLTTSIQPCDGSFRWSNRNSLKRLFHRARRAATTTRTSRKVTQRSLTVTQPPSKLTVLYEDNHCLAVCKDAGMLTVGDRTGDPARQRE